MTDKLIPLNALNSYFDCMLDYENKLLSDPNTSDRTKDMVFGSKTVLELAKKAVSEIAEVSRWETEDNTAHWIKHDDEFGLTYECSSCHVEGMCDGLYCPSCGSRMTNGEKPYIDEGEKL